jgi:glucokinase
MTNLSRQAIVGDIGHTNIRFALADIDELTIADHAYLSTAMFSEFGEALRAYLRTIPQRPGLISLAVAGPVTGDEARLRRADWRVSAAGIRAILDAEVCLINDFEALAMLLPDLVPHDLYPIGGGAAEAGAPCVVLGPGTALEVAALVPAPAGAVAVGGQAGAIRFAAADPLDLALVRAMRPGLSYVAVGDVLSSGGLVELERALSHRGLEDRLTAAGVVKAAGQLDHPGAREALKRFAGWLGGFAGDMALLYGAAGGVYIAGGMAPAMLDALSDGAFRTAFGAKGAASEALAGIPVNVITAPDACLRGAALAARGAIEVGRRELTQSA